MKKRHLILMLLAVFAVAGVVAARYPGNVAAGGGETPARGTVETAVSTQTIPTDEDLIDETDYPDPFTAAAEAIGITEDQLWEALDSGKTIAEVAQANSTDVQKVIDAMVAAENSFIDQLLADGEIDTAEADEWRSEVVEYITEAVNEVMDDEYFEEDFDEEFVDPFVITAETIGVDEDTLWEALENGKTVANVAQEKNVDPQTVIDALVAEESKWIDEMLADEKISAEEADEWRAELTEYAAEFVNNGLEFLEDAYYDDDFDEDFVDPTITAAELIGIEEDTLWGALEAGKTIADVAKENNVDPQTIVDALVAEESQWIDEMVADEEISAEEADEWRAEAAEYAAEFVNEGWDFEGLEDGVALYLPEECVLEADGTALADLEIPEACVDGFAVLGETAVTD